MITQKRSKRKSRLLLPPGVISSKLLASLPVPGSCLRPSPTSSRKERRRFKTRGPAKRRGHSRSSWSPSSDLKTAGIVTGARLLPSSFTDLQSKGKETFQNAGPSQAQRALKIVMVPKFTGTAYFAATEKGAKEAVAELKGKGVAIDLLYRGPTVANSDEQIRMVDDLVAQKPDAIIIAPTNPEAMVPVAKKAKASGIKVITYDADVADRTARQWFVNQGTFTQAGAAL